MGDQSIQHLSYCLQTPIKSCFHLLWQTLDLNYHFHQNYKIRRAAPQFAGISAHPAFSAAITVGTIAFSVTIGSLLNNQTAKQCSQNYDLIYRCLLPTLQPPWKEWSRRRTARRSSQQQSAQPALLSGVIMALSGEIIIMMVLVGNSLSLPTIKQLYQHLNRIQLILIFSCAGLVIIWSLPPNALNAAPTYNSNTCDL